MRGTERTRKREVLALRLEGLIPGRGRRRPKRGRPGEDVKQVKVPKSTHTLLYLFAKDRGMTFGEAAAHLIAVGLMHEWNLAKDALSQQADTRNRDALRKAIMSGLRKTPKTEPPWFHASEH